MLISKTLFYSLFRTIISLLPYNIEIQQIGLITISIWKALFSTPPLRRNALVLLELLEKSRNSSAGPIN